jgi:hypothetical protein
MIRKSNVQSLIEERIMTGVSKFIIIGQEGMIQ